MRFEKIKSHAKVNLSLNVLGKRKSKLHDLETLVAFVDLHDQIFIKRTNNKNHIVKFSGNFSNKVPKINTVSNLLNILDKKKINTPILLLTAKGEPSERIEGLEVGADDYLTKPFEPKELILRINNILNKTKSLEIKRVIEFGNIKIDLKKLFIFKDDQRLKINSTEKLILEKMINSPGKIFTRDEIASLIDLSKERSIDVIVTRLRKKIEETPKSPKYLQTIRGEGYVLWIE